MVWGGPHQETDLRRLVFRQSIGHGLDRVLPGKRGSVHITPLALDRVRDTVRVVQTLEGGLTACAGLAEVQRIVRIAFGLYGAPL